MSSATWVGRCDASRSQLRAWLRSGWLAGSVRRISVVTANLPVDHPTSGGFFELPGSHANPRYVRFWATRLHATRTPSAAARRSTVEKRASASPLSRRAIEDCDVPMRAGTSVCDSPSDSRCSASARRSRRRSYAASTISGNAAFWRRLASDVTPVVASGARASRRPIVLPARSRRGGCSPMGSAG